MKKQDDELAKVISVTLRTGILLAIVCGVLGSLIYLPLTSKTQPSFAVFQGSRTPFASLHAIGEMAARPGNVAERGLALAEIGVLILMVTPIMRVLLSLVSFFRSGDRLFSGITMLVLAALVLSVFIH